MKTGCVFAALAAVPLAACQPVPDAESDRDVLAAQLTEIEELFSASYDDNRPRLEVYLDYFADDLRLFHPEGHTTAGKAAALEFYTSAFAPINILSLDYSAPDVLVDGDLAVRNYSGTASFSLADDPAEREVTQRYVDVLQRQGGSDWRIVWHAWYPVVGE